MARDIYGDPSLGNGQRMGYSHKTQTRKKKVFDGQDSQTVRAKINNVVGDSRGFNSNIRPSQRTEAFKRSTPQSGGSPGAKHMMTQNAISNEELARQRRLDVTRKGIQAPNNGYIHQASPTRINVEKIRKSQRSAK